MRGSIRVALWFAAVYMPVSIAAESLLGLYLRVPMPPANGRAAAAWVRAGRTIEPSLLAVEASLQKEKTVGASIVPVSPAGAVESPGIDLAVRGYEEYRLQNLAQNDPAMLLASRTAWIAKRFDVVRQRMGTNAVGDHNAVDDELRAWNGLFNDWQSRRRGYVEKAESELASVGDPPMTHDPAKAAAIQAYRLAMLHEIETQLSITRLAIDRFSTAP